MSRETPKRTVPEAEILITATRAGGPGGQNVNKVSSAAEIRWNVLASKGFTEAEKQAMQNDAKLGARLNNEGEIVMKIREERSLPDNKRRALEILNQLVSEALKPTVERIADMPKEVAKRAEAIRLNEKRATSSRKANRGRVQDE